MCIYIYIHMHQHSASATVCGTTTPKLVQQAADSTNICPQKSCAGWRSQIIPMSSPHASKPTTTETKEQVPGVMAHPPWPPLRGVAEGPLAGFEVHVWGVFRGGSEAAIDLQVLLCAWTPNLNLRLRSMNPGSQLWYTLSKQRSQQVHAAVSVAQPSLRVADLTKGGRFDCGFRLLHEFRREPLRQRRRMSDGE